MHPYQFVYTNGMTASRTVPGGPPQQWVTSMPSHIQPPPPPHPPGPATDLVHRPPPGAPGYRDEAWDGYTPPEDIPPPPPTYDYRYRTDQNWVPPPGPYYDTANVNLNSAGHHFRGILTTICLSSMIMHTISLPTWKSKWTSPLELRLVLGVQCLLKVLLLLLTEKNGPGVVNVQGRRFVGFKIIHDPLANLIQFKAPTSGSSYDPCCEPQPSCSISYTSHSGNQKHLWRKFIHCGRCYLSQALH